jgi:hypothetical protein
LVMGQAWDNDLYTQQNELMLVTNAVVVGSHLLVIDRNRSIHSQGARP